MQFQVPQFETENKIVGPFTIAQFVYIALAAILSFLLFPILTTWFWFAVSSALIGGSLAMALIKVNGRPMAAFMVSAFNFFWQPKTLSIKPPFKLVGLKEVGPLPTAKKLEIPRPATIEREVPEQIPPVKKHSRLQDLFNKITTTSSPIPYREESLKQDMLNSRKEMYATIEKPSGETIKVKRIDYR